MLGLRFESIECIAVKINKLSTFRVQVDVKGAAAAYRNTKFSRNYIEIVRCFELQRPKLLAENIPMKTAFFALRRIFMDHFE